MATGSGSDASAEVHCELIDVSTSSLAAVRARPDSALSHAIRQVAEEGRNDAVKAAGFQSQAL